MNRITLAVIGVVATLLVAYPAFAASVVDDVVQTLKEDSVYVDPNTEDTDQDTIGILKAQLRENDNIALVMLPADAEMSSEEVSNLAAAIGKRLDDNRIIGISVGDQFAAFSATMPAGTAQEMMKRAVTVSSNPTETLITFARNIHDWQRLNPEELASPQQAADNSWIGWSIVGGLLFVGVVVFATILLRQARRRVYGEVHNNGPRNLRPYVTTLMNLKQRVPNHELQDSIENVCKYTEAYFSRVRLDSRYSAAAKDAFEGHLEKAEQVIKRYIDISHNPHYWGERPEVELLKQNAVEAINALSVSILTSIRDNSRQIIIDFNVDTSILSAQRYR